jgi:uncharacterized protein
MDDLQTLPKVMSLDELEAYLSSGDAPPECMMLSELDGFLTGIIVGPDFIPPSKWLPAIWGGEYPQFRDAARAQAVLGAIMGRYNEIIHQIEEEAFQPILSRFVETGIVDASDWAYGFAQTIALQPRRWMKMVKSEAGLLLLPIMVLSDADEIMDWLDVDTQENDQTIEEAIEILPVTVLAIAEYWRMSSSEQKGMFATNVRATRTGRNDPCPCGSGKKFKKCCS